MVTKSQESSGHPTALMGLGMTEVRACYQHATLRMRHHSSYVSTDGQLPDKSRGLRFEDEPDSRVGK